MMWKNKQVLINTLLTLTPKSSGRVINFMVFLQYFTFLALKRGTRGQERLKCCKRRMSHVKMEKKLCVLFEDVTCKEWLLI